MSVASDSIDPQQMQEIIAWYDERGLLEIVEGLGSTDDVLVRMVTTIDQRRGS